MGDAQALAPIAQSERLTTLDVLRGFSLFGVLWMNLAGWFGGTSVTATDRAIGWVADWAADSRFYSLLGFLFRIGFAIQLQRAATRGAEGQRIFRRRMLALLAFGLVHGLLIWSGDILTKYALLGLLLMLDDPGRSTAFRRHR